MNVAVRNLRGTRTLPVSGICALSISMPQFGVVGPLSQAVGTGNTPSLHCQVLRNCQGSVPDSVHIGAARPTFLEQLDRVAEVEHAKVAAAVLDGLVHGIAQHLQALSG